jgi:hypothetical protein
MVNNSIGGGKTKKPINSGNRLQQLTEKASKTGSQSVQAGPGPLKCRTGSRKCRTGFAEMSDRVRGNVGEGVRKGNRVCPIRSKSCMLPHRGLPEDFR